MRNFLLISLLFYSGILFAQPETDIFLFEVIKSGDSYQLGEGKNITPRKGYDNQPYFTTDSKSILYVAADSKGQTDVFQYNIQAGSSIQLTRSKYRSEYSPKVMPGGEYFSVVTVEKDSTQRLWYFPLQKEAAGKVLMPKIDSIGYYAWYHKKKLAMFILTDPFSLQRTHRKRQKPKVISQNIGRCIILQGRSDTLSFVQKETEDDWYIKTWAPSTGEVKKLARTLDGQEDFCWTPDGSLIMGDGSKLYLRDPYEDGNWKEFARPEVGKFYRVSMSPDGKYIALVVYK
ncbi:MAG: hypothetical protein MRZ79_09400 [Bacteroidia bacterium]|nr:hypothetical protein [Bacteroidia bacterium]